MIILLKPGKKNEHDKILLIKTDDFEQISYADFFKIAKLLMVNEDRCYPFGAGAQYLIDALQFLRDHSIEETLAKFNC